MPDIVSLGYEIETAQVLAGEAALDELTESTIKADAASKKLKSSSSDMGAQMGRAGQQTAQLGKSSGVAAGGMRNLGLQLNQVAQQGSVTGNYMQALSIQLPDLLLGFGGIGIAAGIAAGALGPLVLGLIGGKDAAIDQTEAFDDLSGAVRNYRDWVDQARSSTADLRDEFAGQTEEMRETLRILQEIALVKALDGLRVAVETIDIDRLRTMTGYLQAAFDDFGPDNVEYQVILGQLQESFGLTLNQANNLIDGLDRLGSATGPEKTVQAARALNQVLLATYGTVQNIPPELQAVAQRVAEAELEAARLQKAMEDAEEPANRLADLDVGSGIRGAVDDAYSLADALGVALGVARAIRGVTDDGALAKATNGGPDAALNASRNGETGRALNEPGGILDSFGSFGGVYSTLKPARARGGRGGGGGGGADPYEQNLQSLIQSLQTEQETLEVWYAESEELLNDHRARKLLGEEEHKEAMLALETEYHRRKGEIADQGAQVEIQARQAVFDAAGGLLSVLASKSKGAAIAQIALSKGMAIAQAVQSTAAGAIKALQIYGPTPQGYAAAASVKAYGAAQVGLIAATGLAQAANVASGGGSASGGAISATTSQEPQQSQTIIIDMPGAPRWMREMAEDLFSDFQEQIGQGRELVFAR
ncbi:hypothetical protein [Oceaniglobus trochenteri]|uniref:hypothetical protein n=1 Tax=Oceaniglobus trochenteri TaxID=2763260 RepID=UPI001D001779|nr:hypothetical protein [Oceaniglobus trochenteri]